MSASAPKQELDEQSIVEYIYMHFFLGQHLNESLLFFCGQDMVLLHHELEVEFPDGRPAENHRATLLEFGRTENGKTTTAMAFTVGIPAAIGALVSNCLTSLYYYP